MTIRYADIFCGCGGLSHAFYTNDKFTGILAVDSWPIAGKVFELNHPRVQHELMDLHDKVNVKMICERLEGKCDILLGGPPCQGFSTLGKRRDNDKRSTLVEAYLEIALKVRPKILLMENVKGIASKSHSSGMSFPEFIENRLTNGNDSSCYHIRNFLINTLDYGLAQTRIRWFCLGVRKDHASERLVDEIISNITQSKVDFRLTLKDVIEDLPHIESGEGADELVVRAFGVDKVVYNHKAMNHGAELLKRFSHVPVGGGLLDVPRGLLTPHLLKMVDGSYGSGGHVKNIYGRLDWNKPCGTIVAGMDKITCGRYVHPSANRLLTPRECARIQSFPDSFRFLGSMVNQYYLIGNAVPPRISEIFADAIQKAVENG